MFFPSFFRRVLMKTISYFSVHLVSDPFLEQQTEKNQVCMNLPFSDLIFLSCSGTALFSWHLWLAGDSVPSFQRIGMGSWTAWSVGVINWARPLKAKNSLKSSSSGKMCDPFPLNQTEYIIPLFCMEFQKVLWAKRPKSGVYHSVKNRTSDVEGSSLTPGSLISLGPGKLYLNHPWELGAELAWRSLLACHATWGNSLKQSTTHNPEVSGARWIAPWFLPWLTTEPAKCRGVLKRSCCCC